MEQTTDLTAICPVCGLTSTDGRAICGGCGSAMNRYAEKTMQETYSTHAAEKLADLEARPRIITIAVLFDIIYALLWPVAYLVSGFVQQRASLHGDAGTLAALGLVPLILGALLLIPFAGAICYVAWAAWSEQEWAWNANLGVFLLFGAKEAFFLHVAPFRALVGLAIAAAMIFSWTRPEVRRWYGGE